MAMTNATALVAPTYAAEKMLGTNPIAMAVPAGNEAPFVADFATTTAANGKLEIASSWLDRHSIRTHTENRGYQGWAQAPRFPRVAAHPDPT